MNPQKVMIEYIKYYSISLISRSAKDHEMYRPDRIVDRKYDCGSQSELQITTAAGEQRLCAEKESVSLSVMRVLQGSGDYVYRA